MEGFPSPVNNLGFLLKDPGIAIYGLLASSNMFTEFIKTITNQVLKYSANVSLNQSTYPKMA
jgi:hypothetical protein